jgi:hypothetical protein
MRKKLCNFISRANGSIKLTMYSTKRFSVFPLGDEGMAYSWVMVVAALVIFGVLFALLMPMINPFLDVVNGMITDGDLSQQTADHFNFHLVLLIGCPAILLIGFFVYLVQRSIEVGGDR